MRRDGQGWYTDESRTRMVLLLNDQARVIDGAAVLGRNEEIQTTAAGILAKIYGNLENSNSDAMVHFVKETRNRVPSSTYIILVIVDLTAADSNLPQNVIKSNTWSSWDNGGPHLLPEPLLIRQDRPVGAMLCLKPLEIINLVPLILHRVFSRNHLHRFISIVTRQ